MIGSMDSKPTIPSGSSSDGGGSVGVGCWGGVPVATTSVVAGSLLLLVMRFLLGSNVATHGRGIRPYRCWSGVAVINGTTTPGP